MAKTILKLTETLAVVKISGAGTETITLGTDLLSTTQIVSGSPKVAIAFLSWTTPDNITITRNATEVYKLYTNTGEFDLGGNGGMLDVTQGTSDIAVTIPTGGVIFLTLRKLSGYTSKIEPHQFGSYDNTTVVGS